MIWPLKFKSSQEAQPYLKGNKNRNKLLLHYWPQGLVAISVVILCLVVRKEVSQRRIKAVIESELIQFNSFLISWVQLQKNDELTPQISV